MDAQSLWDAIDHRPNQVVDPKIVKRARAFLLQTLPEDLLLQVATPREAKDIWEALKRRFHGADCVQKARVQTLNREFELLEMQDSEIDGLAAKITKLASKIRSLGSSIPEEKLVKKLLNSVPDRFLSIVASIEQYSDLETMPFEEAVGRLKTYEERIKPRDSAKSSLNQLLYARSDWQDRQKGRWGQAGKGRGRKSKIRGAERNDGGGRGSQQLSRADAGDDKDSRTRNGDGKRERRKLRCFNCDKIGHFSAECRAPRKTEEGLNLVREEDEPMLLLAMHSSEQVMLNEQNMSPSTLPGDQEQGEWFFDNGASNHMTGQRSFFGDLDETTVGSVKFGDKSTVAIRGKGSVALRCKNGDQKVISNVYYIHDLCSKILSLGQLTESSCKVVMSGDFLRVYDNRGALLPKVQKSCNHLYKIKLQTTSPVCLLSKIEETAWLWHARLGHPSFSVLNDMSRLKMVTGVPKLNHLEELCEACMVGKHRRRPFPSKTLYRAKQPLELVHADLCGPITQLLSIFLLLVDDHTRFMWAYVIKSKDQALEKFKIFKTRVEQEMGKRLQTLRTDRGGEFASSGFTNFCNENGIQLTAPYTPQQNGVVERRNQTILGVTRSMMKAMNLPWFCGQKEYYMLCNC